MNEVGGVPSFVFLWWFSLPQLLLEVELVHDLPALCMIVLLFWKHPLQTHLFLLDALTRLRQSLPMSSVR
eukprot:1586398-Rhodomonas_salina.1